MPKPHIFSLGSGVSFEDTQVAASLGYPDADMQTSLLPARLRRRTSTATKLAFAAAERACAEANIAANNLPVLFVSTLGEANITHQLCHDIAQQNFPISPTKFHNSVHNTASGYWSIATGNQHPAMAMAAYHDGFALALLEAWAQLHTVTEQILLVCYEEQPSQQLLPHHTWIACATAFVLSVHAHEHQPTLSLSMPKQGQMRDVPLHDNQHSPALASLKLYNAMKNKALGRIDIAPYAENTWELELMLSHA